MEMETGAFDTDSLSSFESDSVALPDYQLLDHLDQFAMHLESLRDGNSCGESAIHQMCKLSSQILGGALSSLPDGELSIAKAIKLMEEAVEIGKRLPTEFAQSCCKNIADRAAQLGRELLAQPL